MMHSVIKHDNEVAYNVNEYVCNSVADLNSLPRCAPGSTAIILGEDNIVVYMKSPEGKWVEL